jgi:thioredoxin-dependent peroxiredoxin
VALGVSPDSAESHRKFKAKYGLPMTLLADADHAIAKAYGVWVEKNTFGVKRMGIARTTFVIDPDGLVARVFEKVDPSEHGDAVATALEELKAGRGS